MGLESRQRSWDKYYKIDNVVSFGEHIDGYFGAIRNASLQNPDLLSGIDPKVFMLGGFFPFNSSQYDFVRFCNAIRDPENLKNAGRSAYGLRTDIDAFARNDKYILTDFNHFPLAASDSEDFPRGVSEPLRVQADLRKLPFREDSVDMAFIDHTFIFMDDSSLREASSSIRDVLSENGIVIVINQEPLLKVSAKVLGRLIDKRKVFPRKDHEIEEILAKDLKLILRGVSTYNSRFGEYSTLVFARKDSMYEQFSERYSVLLSNR